MKVFDYDRACETFLLKGEGTIKRTDGEIIKGSLSNIESKYDDPNEVGCMLILTQPDKKTGELVYTNEFEWAKFDD